MLKNILFCDGTDSSSKDWKHLSGILLSLFKIYEQNSKFTVWWSNECICMTTVLKNQWWSSGSSQIQLLDLASQVNRVC